MVVWLNRSIFISIFSMKLNIKFSIFFKGLIWSAFLIFSHFVVIHWGILRKRTIYPFYSNRNSISYSFIRPDLKLQIKFISLSNWKRVGNVCHLFSCNFILYYVGEYIYWIDTLDVELNRSLHIMRAHTNTHARIFIRKQIVR